MSVNIPIPLVDQTLESFCATAWACNVDWAWTDAKRYVFGRRYCQPSTLHVHNFRDSFQNLKAIGYQSIADVLERHSYVTLAKPFLPSRLYERRQEKLWLGETIIRKLQEALSEKTNFCPTCIVEDIELFGFAYAHRSHQTIASIVCHKHGDIIGSIESNRKSKFSDKGYLFHNFHINPKTLRVSNKYYPEKLKINLLILAKFINAALNGKLPQTSPRHRIALISRKIKGKRLQAKKMKNYELVNKFYENIENKFDVNFLKLIFANIPRSDDKAFFKKSHNPYKFRENPLFNLIALSSFFDSPEEFSSAATRPYFRKTMTR